MCDFCAPLSMITINYIIKKYTGDSLLFRIWLSKRCVHVLGGYNESEPTMKISFSRNSWSNYFYCIFRIALTFFSSISICSKSGIKSGSEHVIILPPQPNPVLKEYPRIINTHLDLNYRHAIR